MHAWCDVTLDMYRFVQVNITLFRHSLLAMSN